MRGIVFQPLPVCVCVRTHPGAHQGREEQAGLAGCSPWAVQQSRQAFRCLVCSPKQEAGMHW